MQNGKGMDFEKRLAELEADRDKTLEMIRGVETETNRVIAAANEQGQALNRNLLRIEGAIAFIKAEVLGSGPPESHEHKPLVEVATS